MGKGQEAPIWAMFEAMEGKTHNTIHFTIIRHVDTNDDSMLDIVYL